MKKTNKHILTPLLLILNFFTLILGLSLMSKTIYVPNFVTQNVNNTKENSYVANKFNGFQLLSGIQIKYYIILESEEKLKAMSFSNIQKLSVTDILSDNFNNINVLHDTLSDVNSENYGSERIIKAGVFISVVLMPILTVGTMITLGYIFSHSYYVKKQVTEPSMHENAPDEKKL